MGFVVQFWLRQGSNSESITKIVLSSQSSEALTQTSNAKRKEFVKVLRRKAILIPEFRTDGGLLGSYVFVNSPRSC